MINFPDSPTNGQVFTSGSTSWIYDGVKWGLNTNVAVSNDSMPVGSILWYANTSTAPPGWIAADGSAVSRTTYATLFGVIGTTYGSGDGSTTFNVPSVAATTGKYYIRYTTSLGTVTTTSLATSPVGTMFNWPTTSSYPTGFLACDGSNVSRTSYADLFALIGTTYGSGDGSTTFNLPNIVAAGTGSPVSIIKASLGGIVEPSTVAHAGSHTEGGSDVVTVTGNQIANYQTFRNVIINGAMQVAQRATSLASITTGGYKTADRWGISNDGFPGTWTQSVENDAPTGSGLRKSLKMLVTTGKAVLASNDAIIIQQAIEGQNVQHFAKGTSNAKKFAVSFWVKSNVTGTHIVRLRDTDNTRHICSTYTINTSGTWEKKTIVFAADTTGAFDNDNAISLSLQFWLVQGTNYTSGTLATSWASVTDANIAVGGSNVASATNNYWQITGVQLEAGDVATPFEFEPYDVTLRRCQRYYYRISSQAGYSYTNFAIGRGRNSTSGFVNFTLPSTMRANPIFSYGGSLTLGSDLATISVTSIVNDMSNPYTPSYLVSGTVASGTLAAAQAVALFGNNSASAYVDFDAEL